MLFLQNLTEFNTAHNRRISMLGIGEDGEATPRKRKRTKRGVTFNEDEEIINPEDVDPSVGRFRNLIHSTVIPTKVWMNFWNTSFTTLPYVLWWISFNITIFILCSVDIDYLEFPLKNHSCFKVFLGKLGITIAIMVVCCPSAQKSPTDLEPQNMFK